MVAANAPDSSLTPEHLYATVQEKVAELKKAPSVHVHSAPKNGIDVTDARTGKLTQLYGEGLKALRLALNLRRAMLVLQLLRPVPQMWSSLSHCCLFPMFLCL